MLLRAPFRLTLRSAAGTAALGALLVPASAGLAPADAAAKASRATPVITAVKPANASVGQTLTLRGRHFVRGRAKNTVVFKRDGQRAVFVKAGVATAKLLKVEVPERLTTQLVQRQGVPVATRFHLRVLGRRLGRRFTAGRLSPLIGPKAPSAPRTPPAAAGDGDCDADKQLNRVDPDDDNDLLEDALESRLKLDGCKLDTDGDGVEDGYEYRSASDLNDDEHQEPSAFLPYPEKRPYPNPLFGDADVDYDGDSLTLAEEHALWKLNLSQGHVRSLDALTYSDGEQFTLSLRAANGRRMPTQAAAGYGKHAEFLGWAAGAGYASVYLQDPSGPEWFDPRGAYDIRDFDRDGTVSTTAAGTYRNTESTYYDLDDDGWLSDDERDEDADGLTNFDETRGCMLRSLWDKLYDKETPYYLGYAPLRHDDPDSDGDGVRDGADDQDHDDLPNVMECSRNAASGRAYTDPRAPVYGVTPIKGFVNPYNPCLPAIRARTCNRHPPISSAWAPFNPDDRYYYVLN
jgi:hypothetical protein